MDEDVPAQSVNLLYANSSENPPIIAASIYKQGPASVSAFPTLAFQASASITSAPHSSILTSSNPAAAATTTSVAESLIGGKAEGGSGFSSAGAIAGIRLQVW